MKRTATYLLLLTLGLCCKAQSIDRKSVVTRHNPVITETVENSPAQVGNGSFAFGVDVTGLQTFEAFSTLCDWGWHSFPMPESVSLSDYKPVVKESYGRKIPYILRNPQTPEICDWMRANPHRINLGRIGFVLMDDISQARQEVDLWTGIITSRFIYDGMDVIVRTSCHPQKDIIGVSVESQLIASGRLKIFLDLPYAAKKDFEKKVGDYEADGLHTSDLTDYSECSATVTHIMDGLTYYASFKWSGEADFYRESPDDHRYILSPGEADKFEFSCTFSRDGSISPYNIREIEASSAKEWERYWKSGAAVDLSQSRDPRWMELERRIVLSQYLMKLNETGDLPPQESGLVNNGWFGRFHWEMIWWHGAHFGLWNRMELTDKYLNVYKSFMPEALERAASEGRKGARWPKCTGNINQEWPCEAHALLCWQQPHPIYFAEMEYRINPCKEVLDKWKDIVVQTADYMADLVFWDKNSKRYVIGPPVVPVSENTDMDQTVNPAFELCYFRYGLRTALSWAERTGMPSKDTKQWREVLKHLSEIPVEDGCYITHENMKDMWTSFNFEHPAITGLYGWLPGDGVDIETFRRTFYKVLDSWQMDKIWGWDYPMLAMAAVRLGDYSKAVDLLCTTSHKFGFDVHGLAETWPFPYFPANGGLLAAVAMMCGGWDGCPAASDNQAPGFPSDGSWTVLSEGFNRMQ